MQIIFSQGVIIRGGESMAIRPVYISKEEFPYYEKKDIEFRYYTGFSLKQKQKSFLSLHEAFLNENYDKKILEVSTKSNKKIGVMLSAFSLMICTDKREYSVECAFQGSKVFETGGPYVDLLNKTSREAKKDDRIRNSGKLIKFSYFGRDFALEPKDYFYNWLYINALSLVGDLKRDVMQYDSFTDIEFSPAKSINCQAKAVAIFVGLTKSLKINKALESKETFLQTVYGETMAPPPLFC